MTNTNPRVRISLHDGRVINLELYPDKAPLTVANFLKLVDANFYNNVIFHRNIPNFMIQAGAYYLLNDMLTEVVPTESIKGEFASNGIKNDIKHEVGVISMARTNVRDSASCQFFICSADCPHLDGEYAAFGKTIDEESNKVVIDLSNVYTFNLEPALANFPYPMIPIKSIERI